jgi:hypothetical protein
MAIDTTVGGANANSWATVAEFKAFRDVRLPASATVTAASDALIEAALQAACRNINQNFDWTGTAVDAVQALTWPRSGMLTRNGFAIATTTNPKELKDAQCEMAFQIIAGTDLVGDNAAAQQNVLGVKAGSVSVQFQQTNTSTNEAVDLSLRRLTSEWAYFSNAVPGEVRRLLVTSWYNQPTVLKPIMFAAM